MALCWKIYEIGKGKCCEKLNLTCETRQVQELVCNSCLPGREVLREEHVPSTEEMLWLLRHFVFKHHVVFGGCTNQSAGHEHRNSSAGRNIPKYGADKQGTVRGTNIEKNLQKLDNLLLVS